MITKNSIDKYIDYIDNSKKETIINELYSYSEVIEYYNDNEASQLSINDNIIHYIENILKEYSEYEDLGNEEVREFATHEISDTQVDILCHKTYESCGVFGPHELSYSVDVGFGEGLNIHDKIVAIQYYVYVHINTLIIEDYKEYYNNNK